MERNVELVRTVREAVGDDIDVMADAYMGWTLDYAQAHDAADRALQFALARRGDHSRRHPRISRAPRFGTTPIAAGEHEHTIYGFRQLIEAKSLDYIQFDTNRVGGLTAARKIRRSPSRIRTGGAARRSDAQLPCRDGEP